MLRKYITIYKHLVQKYHKDFYSRHTLYCSLLVFANSPTTLTTEESSLSLNQIGADCGYVS